MRVGRRVFQRLKEELHDSSFMAQRGMWHLMEPRRRDARRGESQESENAKPWLGKSHSWEWNQVKDTLRKSTTGTGRSPNVELQERSGRFARILRTTKRFWEDFFLIWTKKVIEWSSNLKR